MWHEHVVFCEKLVFVSSVSGDLTSRRGDDRRGGDNAIRRDGIRA